MYQSLNATPYDYDEILPLELVREHTKTDDVPAVGDATLKLYRKAALQAAEKYTGIVLTARKPMTEQVSQPTNGHKLKAREFRFTLRHPVAEPFVYYYGLPGDQAPRQVAVKPNSREIYLPIMHSGFGMGCCNPRGSEGCGMIQYVAGLACLSDAPAAIALGALKYIAHVIENAGDNVVVTNAAGGMNTSAGTSAAADPALASGAIDIWRSALDDAL